MKMGKHPLSHVASFFVSKFYIPLSFPLSSWITLDLLDIMIGHTIIASIIINYPYSG